MSNYTKIIHEGKKYVADNAHKNRIVIDLEDKVIHGSEKLVKASEKVAEEIEDFVDEKLRSFFEEVRRTMDA